MPHSRRKRINISLLIPFVILALLFGGLVWKKLWHSQQPQPVPRIDQPAADRTGVLFFAGDDGRLIREARQLDSCEGEAECLKDLLDELFRGPVGSLTPPFPEGTSLIDVQVEQTVAVVDVTREFAAGMPSGSSAEMQAVYSIVNTVCVNYPRITGVVISIEGDRRAVLRHLELGEPLSPDYSLEGAPPAASGRREE